MTTKRVDPNGNEVCLCNLPVKLQYTNSANQPFFCCPKYPDFCGYRRFNISPGELN